MKTALFIEEGICQIVLSPETTEEKRILKLFSECKNIETFEGGFYECEGGWIRKDPANSAQSLIFVLRDNIGG